MRSMLKNALSVVLVQLAARYRLFQLRDERPLFGDGEGLISYLRENLRGSLEKWSSVLCGPECLLPGLRSKELLCGRKYLG